MNVQLTISIGRMTGGPATGRRTVFLALTVNKLRLWLSRWPTGQMGRTDPQHRYLRRGAVMTWYCGDFRPQPEPTPDALRAAGGL